MRIRALLEATSLAWGSHSTTQTHRVWPARSRSCDELVAKDPRNAERIFPYIGGEEVNDSLTHAHHRYVINFGEMSEEEARQWPDLMRIIEEKVKPERTKPSDNTMQRRTMVAVWAIYDPRCIDAIQGMERVLVIPRVTQYAGFVFLPQEMVFSEQLVVFAIQATIDFLCASIPRPRSLGSFLCIVNER